MKDLLVLLDSINTRSDLAEFINLLAHDFTQNPDSWENVTIDRYLEAMAAWVHDMGGYFNNQNLPVPESPDWKLVGEILQAASVYE